MNESEIIEIKEAIDAGNDAIYALEETEKCLNTASSFGIWDILGGGIISSALKHSSMNDANNAMKKAQIALQNFSTELADVNVCQNVDINFNGVIQFVDIFCDNFLVDLFVQSKINDTKKEISKAKRSIQNVVNQLYQML